MWATLSTDDLPRRWPLPEMDQAGARNATPMTQMGSSAELRRGGEPEVESATRKDGPGLGPKRGYLLNLWDLNL